MVKLAIVKPEVVVFRQLRNEVILALFREILYIVLGVRVAV